METSLDTLKTILIEALGSSPESRYKLLNNFHSLVFDGAPLDQSAQDQISILEDLADDIAYYSLVPEHIEEVPTLLNDQQILERVQVALGQLR